MPNEVVTVNGSVTVIEVAEGEYTVQVTGPAVTVITAGAQGPEGPAGSTGPAGPGVPTGGTTGQALTKASGTDYDTTWSGPYQPLDADLTQLSSPTGGGVYYNSGAGVYTFQPYFTSFSTSIGGLQVQIGINSGSGLRSWNLRIGTRSTALNSFLPDQTSAAGKALVSDGTNADWQTVLATPGGSTTQIQFNNSGAFGGSASLTWDGSYLTAPGLQLGTSDTLITRFPSGGVSIETTAASQPSLVITLPSSGTGEGIKVRDGTAFHNTIFAVNYQGQTTMAGGFLSYGNNETSGYVRLTSFGTWIGNGTTNGFTFNTTGIDLSGGGASGNPLRINLAASQTGDGFQLKNSGGSVQFALGPTGQLKTNQTSAATTVGGVVAKMPVYTTAGTLIGYFPVFDLIS